MNEREKLMYRIQQADFATLEAALYLDGHPKSARALEYHKKYAETAQKLKAEYEAKYGPITNTSPNRYQSWSWIANPWPWERGDER